MARHQAAFCRAALLLILWPATATIAQAPDDAKGRFVDRIYRDDRGEHKYVVFVPAGYTAERNWPAILFLHAASERGTDGRQQTFVGLGPLVKARAATFPFLVVFPQAEDTAGRALTPWLPESPDGKRAMAILHEVEKEYRVDKYHIILTGWSMGGFGAWSLAAAHPDRFSAVVPVAGGGQTEWAQRLKNVPFWAFHGATDTAVLPEESREMIAALRRAGANPRYTEVAGAGHEVWKFVYDTDALYKWMLDPQAADTDSGDAQISPDQPRAALAAAEGPFVPALVIPKAIYVRLGNEMLETLAYAIPRAVSPSPLTGRLDDIATTTNTQGRSFNVVFSEITYSVQIHRVQLGGYREDRLNIQLGLQDVRLRIGFSSVRGSGRSASAGPIEVVIGHRRPVWLGLLVQPYVENHHLRFKPVATRLDIPGDNWYVTPPAGVRAEGVGMTRERVSDGLVEGIYDSKARIEQEALAIVPLLLKQVEEKLEFTGAESIVSSIWPLPVYKPLLQLWPEEVSTDADGISVVFSVASAAVSPGQAPAQPLVADPAGFGVDRVPHSTALRVGVAPKMLEVLSSQLIAAGMMHVNVLDISGEFFKPLAERAVLAQAAPDLARYGDDVEISSELVLTKPFTVQDAGTLTGAGNTASEHAATLTAGRHGEPRVEAGGQAQRHAYDAFFEFVAPRLVVSYAIRGSKTQGQWMPYAQVDLTMQHQARPTIAGDDPRQRFLRLDWSGEADIRAAARFAPGYSPADAQIDAEPIRAAFARAWQSWTRSAPASQVAIPDIDFGTTRLRIAEVGWAAPHLFAAFTPPGVHLRNLSTQPLVYETKGPYSDWSPPYTLAPGQSHNFNVPYPLLFRRTDGNVLYTLHTGSFSEFREAKSDGVPRLFQARNAAPAGDRTIGSNPKQQGESNAELLKSGS